MNYANEVNTLKSFSSSFKPTSGSYKVTILSEPVETEFVNEKGEKTPQIRMDIEANNERMTWFVSKCVTYNGLFGQLMLIGQAKKKLSGEQITLLVKMSNNKREYTIVEAVDLIKAATKK